MASGTEEATLRYKALQLPYVDSTLYWFWEFMRVLALSPLPVPTTSIKIMDCNVAPIAPGHAEG